MGMDQIGPPVLDQSPDSQWSDRVEAPGAADARRVDALACQLLDQMVFPGQHVGNPIMELVEVPLRRSLQNQPLGASNPQPLDEDQNATTIRGFRR